MTKNLAGQVFFPQPTTSPGKPALVVYPDSDSDGSSLSDAPEVSSQSLASDTLELSADSKAETEKFAAAEQLLALAMDQPAAADNLERAIAESSHRYDHAQHQDTNMDDNDETISDINNETHDIEFETALVDGEEQAEGSDNTPRCWGDIKYPRIGTCDHEFRIKNSGERYRKVVSDFFGRNKKATSSVPPDCYPTICRTCYQRLAYRLGSMNKDEPEKDAAAVAKLRCDAIIAALEKMKQKTFVDRHGYEWPWWCGLELQLTNDGQALLKQPEELEAEIEKKNAEVAKQKAEKAQSPKGNPFKRLHKRVKPEYLPDWLQKLCQANTGDDIIAQASTSTIGDRNGVRYSFDELVLIIKAIKTYCHESRCTFPTIEAIPVPIGLLDEQILREMRKQRAATNNMRTKTKRDAAEKERESRDQPSNTLRKTRATTARELANDASAKAIAGEQAVDQAQEDASLSAGTFYNRRNPSYVRLIETFCRYNPREEKQVGSKLGQSWQGQADYQGWKNRKSRGIYRERGHARRRRS